MKYEVYVKQNIDGSFTGLVKDLPGALVQGETLLKLRQNISEIIHTLIGSDGMFFNKLFVDVWNHQIKVQGLEYAFEAEGKSKTNINSNMETTKRKDLLEAIAVDPKDKVQVSDIIADDQQFITRYVQDCENNLADAERNLTKRMKSLTPLDKSVISGLYSQVAEAKELLKTAKEFKELYF